MVLTRKIGESIVIEVPATEEREPYEITVSLREIRGWDRVRLGVECPRDVRVLREELLQGGDEKGG